MKNKVFVQIDI